MHLEAHLKLILDLRNHALVSNDEEVLHKQTDCSQDSHMFFNQDRSSVDM